MEKLREKRQAMQDQLEETEKREMLANKKLSRLQEITTAHQRECETLRRSCALNEYNLDKKEDFLEEKLNSLKDALLKKEREDQIIKVLEKRELDMDDEASRLEPKVKQAIQKADEVEMKFHEARRKLTLTQAEFMKIKARKQDKEEQVRELEESLKTAGRQIRHLEVLEEKSGDREDQKYHHCRKLIERIDECIMRAEESERRIRMLQKTYNALEEEKITYDKNCKELKRELNETLNSLDHV